MVYISIGSNVDRERHIRASLEELEERFGNLEISPVYETTAVGFEGDDFLNLVVGFASYEAIDVIVSALHEIEDRYGRDRGAERFAPRTLDLDVLLYGNEMLEMKGMTLPRPELLEYVFMLAPLTDLVPDQQHPVDGRTYREILAAFGDAGKLRKIIWD